MEDFTLEDLRAVVELSSVCFGVLQKSTGRISAPNQALRQRVGRTEFFMEVAHTTEERMYGRLKEEGIPMSLRILGGGGDSCLVEVYLANAKAQNESLHTSDLIRLVDMTSDGVWEWFPTMQYEFMSERFWSILGYDHKLMPSTPNAWMSIIDPSGLALATKMFNDHVATRGKSPYNLNVTYTHKNGHDVQVKCRGAVVEWLPDGTPWRLLGTHTDITEITEAVEAKARFVARMSHEIRTPICAILHECENLNHPGGTAIADACDQLLTLCNDFLTADKLRRPHLISPSRRSAGLEEFLRRALRRHLGEAQKKGVDLKGSVLEAPSTPVMMDVGKCNQVVDNLVSNAIKYTASGGGVCVELSCKPRTTPIFAHLEVTPGQSQPKVPDQEVWQVEVVVRDTGQGIHEDDREYVFNRFSQGNSSVQGAGLGLSISKELAKLLSGDVYLANTAVGKGSTFVFSFPAATTTPTKRVVAENGHIKQEKSEDNPVVRILSADDMLTNRKIMRRRLRAIEEQLSEVSIDVIDAVDGRDAVTKFKDKGKFDLVFMDCLMPDMNGFEAATKIHRLCVERGIPLVPVVAVTASVSTSLHEECREAGMMQVVTKPFDVIDLMPVFNAVIDARRAQTSSSTSTSSRQAATSATSCSPSTKGSIEGAGRPTVVRSLDDDSQLRVAVDRC